MNRNLLLLETIRLEDGVFHNLSYHQRRVQASSLELWGCPVMWNLGESIWIPENKRKDLYKVRVVYGPDTFKPQILPYTIRDISSLKLVFGDHIDYGLKYEDRSEINTLFDKRGDCDEILIIRDGLITDTSYANVVLFDGEKWYTPKYPLLPGTRREKLLHQGKILEADIRPQDLDDFLELRIINAMIDMDHSPSIPVSTIQ
ncbi:MAG: hypothetical protein DWQ02_16525 [Bacteroidetes bacterium]|nr:MAG: hypothetical protein DWQ02_16525 [Bacteroidota bacterium]